MYYTLYYIMYNTCIIHVCKALWQMEGALSSFATYENANGRVGAIVVNSDALAVGAGGVDAGVDGVVGEAGNQPELALPVN